MIQDLNQFYLMHKNDIAAVITLDADSATLLNCAIINNTFMPLGHADLKAFRNWWERRAIPKHQLNQATLHENQSNLEYMVQNLGLSLIDSYWVKPITSDYTWENSNLYTHNFKEIDFDFQDLENISPFKPSATTQGELQKRWIIKENERFLVKGNYGAMFRQSMNEIFATKLHELQGKEHTHYDMISLPTTMGNGIGCISKDFTNLKLEFIPAYDIVFHGTQKNEESVYQYYIRNCIELGIPEKAMQDFMDYQILSDFLISNKDRHLLNLGVLRDTDTLQLICPAPIFDSGNSMFYDTPYNPDTILEIPTTSFYKKELKMVDQVKNYAILDLNKLPSVSFIKELYAKDPYSVVYLDNMIKGYEKKIDFIDVLQRGLSLNKRHPLFYLNRSEQDLASFENHDDIDFTD